MAGGGNRRLWLGLSNRECHFAVYPPGGFYRCHLDWFRDSDLRAVTVIVYLNRGWRREDGGRLRLQRSGETKPS